MSAANLNLKNFEKNGVAYPFELKKVPDFNEVKVEKQERWMNIKPKK